MEMTGEQRIDAPRDRVWAALNDPEVLKQCIPGCQSLEKLDDDRMRAVAAVKVGPIGARFTGEVTISELDPPNGYRIAGEGQGGVAGFAKGEARVQLAEDGPTATRLNYEVSAQVRGRLAQLGGPIIDATANQITMAFFRKLSDVVAPAVPAAGPGSAAEMVQARQAPAPAPGVAARAAASGGLPVAWILSVVVGVLAGVLLGRGEGIGWISVVVLLVLVAFSAHQVGRRGAGGTQA